MVKKKTLQESKEKLPEPTEASLQEQIVLLLRLKGYLVHIVHKNVANKDWVKGIPDLHVLGNGRTLYIECKSKKGKLSPSQEEGILFLRSHGMEVRVVDDISQIQDLLDID
jgi:hypothetical protein